MYISKAYCKNNFGTKILVPWDTFGVPGPHISKSAKAGPLVFGAQAVLYLPLLESEPTSYGGGPLYEHLVSDTVPSQSHLPFTCDIETFHIH